MKELEKSVEMFVDDINAEFRNYFDKDFANLEYKPVEFKSGLKYYKLTRDTSVWGFISKYDGMFKGIPVKVGDLLMAASYNSPAKHSRGNIIDGTASYDMYGPNYLRS